MKQAQAKYRAFSTMSERPAREQGRAMLRGTDEAVKCARHAQIVGADWMPSLHVRSWTLAHSESDCDVLNPN